MKVGDIVYMRDINYWNKHKVFKLDPTPYEITMINEGKLCLLKEVKHELIPTEQEGFWTYLKDVYKKENKG